MTGGAGLGGDRGVEAEGIVRRVATDAGEVYFFHGTLEELFLEESGEVAGAADDGDSGGIGVYAMRGPGPLRMKGNAEKVLQGIAVVASAGVKGERGGFVEHDERFVHMKEPDAGVDVRFAGGRKQVEQLLAVTNPGGGGERRFVFIEQMAVAAGGLPPLARLVRENRGEAFQYR